MVFGGLILGVVAVLLLVGIVLLAMGVRGRLSSLAPHCRTCRFDLTGAADRCPECGALLNGMNAVRRGLRTPRRRMAFTGAVFLLLAIGGITAFTLARARGFNWNTIKPAALLIRELSSVNPKTHDEAMKELHSRLTAGSLRSHTAASVLTIVLDHQSKPGTTWAPSWGSVVDTAWTQGLLTAEQTQSFARNAALLEAEIRPRIAAGDQANLSVKLSANRIGQSSRLRVSLRHVETTQGEQVVSRGGGGASSMGLSYGGWAKTGISVNVAGPPGTYELTSTWAIEVFDDRSPTPLATWEQVFSLPLDVLPAGTQTVEVIIDESLRTQIESNLTISRCAVTSVGTTLHGNGMINLQGSPIPLAFDVFWVDPAGNREWPLGKVTFTGSGGAGYGFGRDIPADFNLAEVDVVLRPSPAAAARTHDLFRIWGGEIRRTKVPVKLPPE